MIVAFSGIDCSGKSTQISRLSTALAAAGQRPRVMWLRPGYSPLLDGLRRLVRRVRPSALPTVADPAARQRVFQQGRVQKVWVVVALADAILHYGLVARWWHLVGQVVICDRYVEDALLDLRLRFPGLGTDEWRLARLLRALSPRPGVQILLAIPREEMLRRMETKQEPFPDAPEIRDRRYDEYLGYGDRGYVVVDGARPIEDVHRSIWRLVVPGEAGR